jgi:hypothetical protein
LVSIDTLRADHVGCYGYPRDTTPNIDAFSRDGVRFRTAIAHASSTTASHASIFTSLLPLHHGAQRARRQPISDDVDTMAQIMQGAGYRTVSYNGGGQVAAMWGFDRGFDIYESDRGAFARKVQKAIRWMDGNAGGKFFMFLHTYEVHAPYTPAARFMAAFDADYAGNLDDEISTHLLIEINNGTRTLDQQDARHIVNAYDAEIRSMDEAFGTLVGYLKRRGLLDRTILVFTSDHGEEFGEHGQFGRHSHALYDELLRVPLIVRLPGGKFAGKVVERQVRGIDILPTVLDLLDLESPDQCDGSSLTPLMRKRRGTLRAAVSQIDARQEPPMTSIRTESKKLILGTRSFVDGAAHRWYASRMELAGPLQDVDLPIESFHAPRRLRISLDGDTLRETVIQPRKRPLSLPAVPAGGRLTLEALTPCTRPADVGIDLDLPCVSFRVFDPFEFFLLEKDPGEQRNRFDAAGQRRAVARLRRQLDEMLTGRAPADPDQVQIDRTTRERLKALGYAD